METAEEQMYGSDWVGKEKSFKQITREIFKNIETAPGKMWWLMLSLTGLMALVGVYAIGYLIYEGIGTWGLNSTIGWAWGITNFVFWVGIGHAGTLISAILLLFRQRWRNSINRMAEAMTIFAVICAGLFPVLHTGRPYLAYWLIPYPNNMGPLWVNFRSALVWDVFAISTYLTVSFVFWYIGMIPDLAAARDHARLPQWRKNLYGVLSMGWDNSQRSWARYEKLTIMLSGLATALVVSVHTVVSFDFATGLIPGWHSTIFPPYFVDGAIFSGFAMVLTLFIPTRKFLNLKDYLTDRHIEVICKVIILTGSILGLSYGIEFFMAWYSGHEYEQYVFLNRMSGPYAPFFWTMITCNVISPHLLWFQSIRKNMILLFIISLFINVGMWMERFVIIATSLHRDFLPANWSLYSPTWVEICIYIGTFGIFLSLFLLFVKVLPVVPISEVKMILERRKHGRT